MIRYRKYHIAKTNGRFLINRTVNRCLPIRRHVPKDVILLQADEVVTKSLTKGCKWNKTFTATIEDGNGRREYLVSRTAFALQILVGVVLLCLGLGKKRLEVISDGASWISTWVSRILKVDTYHILCWYHLCKRVYEGLSGIGASKKERRQLELEALGLLWKGEASEAIAFLRSLLPRCRVRDRVENLIDYLVRKQSQIADNEKRHEQGLWIASTRVERWNDIAVSERCKGRGMSWVDTGVLAIALYASEKTQSSLKNNLPILPKRVNKSHHPVNSRKKFHFFPLFGKYFSFGT